MNGYEQPMSHRPRQSTNGLLAFVTLVSLIIAGVLLWLYLGARQGGGDPNLGVRPVTARGELADDEKTTIAIFRRVSPAVTHITRLGAARRSALGRDVRQIPQGTGSGFVWDQHGHVVT